MRECRECSFQVPEGESHCPKCDADLLAQSDGTIYTIDVAHRRETVEQAIRKLESAVKAHRGRWTHSLRVIVGRGKIGREVRDHLSRMRANREILGFETEERNPGSLIVRLKK